MARADLATMRRTVEVYEASHAVLPKATAAAMKVTLLLAAQATRRRSRYLSRKLQLAADEIGAALKETRE